MPPSTQIVTAVFHTITPKSKMISFRLSAEEYDRLHAACVAGAARNVSELARVAMHRLIESGSSAPTLSDQLRDLRIRVDALSAELNRLILLHNHESNGRGNE